MRRYLRPRGVPTADPDMGISGSDMALREEDHVSAEVVAHPPLAAPAWPPSPIAFAAASGVAEPRGLESEEIQVPSTGPTQAPCDASVASVVGVESGKAFTDAPAPGVVALAEEIAPTRPTSRARR